MYKTQQESFWAGEFGDRYVERNDGARRVASNTALFARVLRSTSNVTSITELGCNIGLNLIALHALLPECVLRAHEINQLAAERASSLGIADITAGTILNPIDAKDSCDLAFTKGVLIHINPDELPQVYDNLYRLSRKYILVCEYYNPVPVSIAYRGHQDRLFKRDFAGEMMEKYDLELVDYGFSYRRDPLFPQDDATWFLMLKR